MKGMTEGDPLKGRFDMTLSAAAYRRSTRQTYAMPKMEDLDPYKDSNVLVFAPHQDDDTLGCGGTIRRLVEMGAKVTVVYLTDGGKGSDQEQNGLVKQRQEEAVASLNVLGCRSRIFLGFEDGALDYNSESLGKVRGIIERLKPAVIFTPHLLDGPWDHIMTSVLVSEALRDHPDDLWVYNYEVWNTIPYNCLVDISDVIGLKMEAIRKHKSQMRMVDYSEKFLGLSVYRSLVSPGCKNCEAFLKLSREQQVSTLDVLSNGFLPI